MNDYTIQQGETLRLTVTVTEEGAATAELVASDGTNSIIKTANFSGMVADLTTTDTDVPAGEYPYYIRITWDDGTVDVLGDKGGCESGDCEQPVITVCEIGTS